MDALRYALGVVLILPTIYCGIRGLFFKIGDMSDKEGHKARALYLSATIVLGLISFEMFYPTIDAVICLPVPLIGVWLSYLIAMVQFKKLSK